MMRQMREATKPIMLFTALAFVALMVFQWGMDITGKSAGGAGDIGEVNGEPVSYEQYQYSYRNLFDQAQNGQEDPVSTAQNKQIEDAAWNDVVNQTLIRQELKRRGIGVTDEEIRQAAQFSPPPELRNDPAFKNEDGSFNIQAYQSFLATLPGDQLLLLESYYRDAIPRGKLLRQVSSGLFISDAELWDQYRDQNEQVQIRYIPLNPATRYDDSEIRITDAEVQEYYAGHQKEFEFPARASVKVVVLDRTPTPADTAAALAHAREVRQEILDGADFADVAKRESADQSTAQNGGELGTFARGRMVSAFDSAAFAAPVGRVTEPVKTPFGYHLIEVEKRQADSVTARHILIPIKRTDDSELKILTLADSLEALGSSLSLDDAASALGVKSVSMDISENFAFVTGAGQITEGADWAFHEAAPGDVSPVFENQQAFYTLELVSLTPEGVLPLEQARPAIEETLGFNKRMERAKADGATLLERVKGGEALENVASDMGFEIRSAGPFSRNDFVPGIGRQNAVIGTAFGLPVGIVSDVVETPANAYLVQVVKHIPADSTAWIDQRLDQRRNAIAIVQQTQLQEWLAGLRAAATIVDRRANVLQSSDQELPLQPNGPLGKSRF